LQNDIIIGVLCALRAAGINFHMWPTSAWPFKFWRANMQRSCRTFCMQSCFPISFTRPVYDNISMFH